MDANKHAKKSYVLFSLQTSNHLLGPKPFPLDRLLAILYSIVDSRVAPTANIFSQVGLMLASSLPFPVSSSGSMEVYIEIFAQQMLIF